MLFSAVETRELLALAGQRTLDIIPRRLSHEAQETEPRN